MNESNTARYIKTYGWQGAAFFLRFLSLFIVSPFLTKNPAIYGIYAICVSITIYLNYADLGFLRACQKFAAESFGRNDREQEERYIGFGAFILVLIVPIISSVFFVLSINPHWLIKGLDTPEKREVASNLLLILSLFSLTTIMQRMIGMIFSIRLESYKYQRLSLMASLITIGSAYFFFRNENYRLVEYYLFSNLLNVVVIIASIIIVKRRYNYNIRRVVSRIVYDSAIYKKTMNLAYSGLYLTVVWIVFYEFDQVAIAKLLGAEKVAIFAIAVTFLSLFRNIFGIIFNPFNVRANHYVGNGDLLGLKRFTTQIITITGPVFLIPTFAFAVVAKPFILSWVGPNYAESVRLASLLALFFSFSYISYTASMIQVATERLKVMNVIETINPVVYWLGIALTIKYLGLLSFPIFKLIAALLTQGYCIYFLARFLDISPWGFMKKFGKPIIAPLVLVSCALYWIVPFLPSEKSKMNLLIVLATTAISIIIGLFVQYATSSSLREVVQGVFLSKKRK